MAFQPVFAASFKATHAPSQISFTAHVNSPKAHLIISKAPVKTPFIISQNPVATAANPSPNICQSPVNNPANI